MKILVLGASGMLGSAVFEFLTEKYGKDSVVGTSRNLSSENDFVLFDVQRCNSIHIKRKFDYIINCIGIIKPVVNKVGIATAIEINSVFPHRLASYCEEVGTKLIHITTDCVFSGKKGNYTEEDLHDVTDVYGRSKSLGEPENCMVLRTSIIGEEKHNKVSLVEWTKSQKGEEVNGYINHYWNGVTTKQYAKICSQIMDENLYEHGTFHVFSPDDTSKYNLLGLLGNKFDLNLKLKQVNAPQRIDRTLRTVKDLNSKLDIPDLQQQIWEM